MWISQTLKRLKARFLFKVLASRWHRFFNVCLHKLLRIHVGLLPSAIQSFLVSLFRVVLEVEFGSRMSLCTSWKNSIECNFWLVGLLDTRSSSTAFTQSNSGEVLNVSSSFRCLFFVDFWDFNLQNFALVLTFVCNYFQFLWTTKLDSELGRGWEQTQASKCSWLKSEHLQQNFNAFHSFTLLSLLFLKSSQANRWLFEPDYFFFANSIACKPQFIVRTFRQS